MNWNPFELFKHRKSPAYNTRTESNNAYEVEVIIGQLFEFGPMVEIIDFVSIPSDEKNKKLETEIQKRIRRKEESRVNFLKAV